MTGKMPEGLRKHFEAKAKKGEPGEKHDADSKMIRKEALRKAQKATVKRKAEKDTAKS